jgi:hypothetical protein
MRTKTLLLTAATVVAGFLSAQADTVYSQNVVGYINVTVPANGFYFLGNQLTNAGTGNDIQQVLTNGPVSDPNGQTNTQIFLFNPGANTYANFAYYTASDADNALGQNEGNGWYTPDGNLGSGSVKQGAGSFLKNSSPQPITVTLIGQVPQGTNNVLITPGFNTYCIVPPISTNIDATLLGFPGQSDPNGQTNDTYYLFQPASQSYFQASYYTAVDADNALGGNSGDGFYLPDDTYVSTNSTDWPKVGQAFFIFHPSTSTNVWQVKFNVQ